MTTHTVQTNLGTMRFENMTEEQEESLRLLGFDPQEEM
jgi:hypothetical protein